MYLFCDIQTNDSLELNTSKKMKSSIDENLFSKIAENDMLALEDLYRLTDSSVYSFALSILKNTDDAQDVMQDTYLKIRSGAHLYRPQGKPLAWIFTIVRNLCFIKIRNSKKNCSFEEGIENSIEFSYFEDLEDRLIMNTLLTTLSQEERQLIILYIVCSFTHKEIASFLQMNLSTELSKYHRALKKLKKQLMEGR